MSLRISRSAIVALAFFASPALVAQVTLTTPGTAVTENFDTLVNTGTGTTLPAGWGLGETGTNANTTYTAGTGSSNAGDSYSFGTAAATDRALGGVQSGSLIPGFGAELRNNTGGALNGLQIGYTGEHWRFGATGRADRIDFQYSTDATSLTTGTWTDVNTLDFSSPTQPAAAGALDGNLAANRTVIAPVAITGLNVANGASVWIRWQDLNATGADDGLAIDDVSITPQGAGTAIGVSVNDVTVTEGNSGTVNAAFVVSLSSAATAASSVSFATSDGTASAPSDYTALTQTVSFAIGESSKTVNVVVNGDTTVEPTETFNVTLSAPINLTIGDGAGVGTVTNDDFVVTAINAVQGSGLVSPLANGTTVTIEGIVTGIKSNGFFVQSATPDANPATSEGILVFTGAGAVPAAVVRGASVRVTGNVLEFIPTTDPDQPPTTELVGPLTITQLSTGNALPTPAVLPTVSPAGNNNQLENLEHMRVSLTNVTVVGGTRGFVNEPNATGSTNGVFWVTQAGAARPRREPGIDVRETLIAGMPAGVPRFDGNPETIRVDSDAQVTAPALELVSGQTITALDGVLDYGLRFYTFLPDPSQSPTISAAPVANSAAPAGASEFTVASYNLQRFFDTTDDAGTSDPVLTATAFANRLSKASRQIRVNLGAPDIIAVVEVENLSTLEAIAAQVATDGGPRYAASLFEGNDPGGIDVGFLFKTQIVTGTTPRLNNVITTQTGLTATFLNPITNMQDTVNDRPPVVLTARINSATGSADVAVIVNHLRSFLGVTDATDGPRIRAKRLGQAEFLANLIQARQAANPNERLVVVGDFNAYEFNDGYVDVMGSIIGAPAPASQVLLAGADLVNPNLTRMVDASADYSYLFDGFTQNIDHILVSQGLINNSSARSMTHVRLNADYPETFRSDYSATSNVRLSDHDALVLRVTVPALGATPTSCILTSTTTLPTNGVPVNYSVALSPNSALGSVTVSANTGESCTASVTGGVANCSITYAAPGQRTLNAAFTGAGGFQNSTCGPLSQAILVGDTFVTVQLGSAPNPSAIGQNVTLIAAVTGLNPTGTVEFATAQATIATAPLIGTGNARSAQISTANLPVGTTTVFARYSGDANNGPRISAPVAQVVNAGVTTTAISVNPNPPIPGQPLLISAAVTVAAPAVGPATGTVTFFDGTTILGTATLVNGAATFNVASVPLGNRSYRVRYDGNASYLTSSSTVVASNFVVQAPTIGNLGMLLLAAVMVGFGIGASKRKEV
jgi:uncharacterized protein